MNTEKKTLRIPIMMSIPAVLRVDQWRSKQPDLPTRAEAMRRLMEKALDGEDNR